MKTYTPALILQNGKEVSFSYKGLKVSGIVGSTDNSGFRLRLTTDYICKNEEWYVGDLKYFQYNLID